MLEGAVRILGLLAADDFFNEEVLQNGHFKSVQDSSLMCFDQRFRISDGGEGGLRGLGQVLQHFLAARHEPFWDVDRQDDSVGVLNEFRKVKNAKRSFFEPTPPLRMCLSFDVPWHFAKARILLSEGTLKGKAKREIV